MDSVNPMSSATSLLTNESTGQTRSTEERNPLTPPAPPQDTPRVNEGPSTITTISPQAQQLAQQEQQGAGDEGANPPTDNSPPPRNDAQQADGADDQAPSQAAEPSNNAPEPEQAGRAFNDQSTNSFLRN